MDCWYKYAILRVCPDKIRGEIVNIGLLVIHPSGEITTHLGSNLSKARALDGNLSDAALLHLTESVSVFAVAADTIEDKIDMIRSSCNGGVMCSQFGEFVLNNTKDYGQKITSLLDLLVNSKRRMRASRVQRISTKMRNLYSDKNLLGTKDDIDNHLIVPNFPIDDKSLFKADFALKNSVMHITQTIDLNTSDSAQKHAEAALKALTLDKAADVYGDGTKRYVVYAASSARENQMASQIELLHEYSTGMYNLQSRQEMSSYFNLIEQAVHS
jgi:hypothetical protein